MEEKLYVRGEYIKLDQALKSVFGMSGAEAKDCILDGAVFVNGEAEFRRGRKLRGGEVVQLDETAILILSSEEREA